MRRFESYRPSHFLFIGSGAIENRFPMFQSTSIQPAQVTRAGLNTARPPFHNGEGELARKSLSTTGGLRESRRNYPDDGERPTEYPYPAPPLPQ
ncbi:hypothetical protein [Microbulbifer sp. 2205BS26-8]|uniref:hypothetical protein n=1 Tax=Microbulbifer sp. 2205BS26-8 TaxID=3064386 RepID=UPI00273F19D1|nr:hypothetical protein [Microbulbifer sp. 2205BS26-8]MDP5209457.1 hypothetical protein [Microbulbifer sp. 2205BS26-8]